MSRYFRAKIADNHSLNSKTFLITISPFKKAPAPKPGQFYMIEAGDSYDPFLKRPFSFFRKTSGGIQFLYTVKGKGTSLMKDYKRGKVISIIGPLGTGYPKPEKGVTPLLVAGGTGIASIFSLAENLSKRSCLMYGAKCKDELLIINELKCLCNKPVVCTDDGSAGEKCTVADLLNNFLRSRSAHTEPYILYACGPKPMLEVISSIATKHGIKGYVSLEENMACGFGACLGCVVKTVNGYKRVCKEGPVFPIEEIIW